MMQGWYVVRYMGDLCIAQVMPKPVKKWWELEMFKPSEPQKMVVHYRGKRVEMKARDVPSDYEFMAYPHASFQSQKCFRKRADAREYMYIMKGEITGAPVFA